MLTPDPNYDPIYHIAESLARIAHELERIRVAEGPCSDEYTATVPTRFRDFDGNLRTSSYTVTHICSLAAGHTGDHCSRGPFESTQYPPDWMRWPA